MTDLGGNNKPSATERLSGGDEFRPNMNARLAGGTVILPHPDGSLNDPNNAELQEYLRSIGMNGAADPVSQVVSTAVDHESVVVPVLPDAFGNAMDHSSSELGSYLTGETTL